jgi:squalene synthase HpnC
LIYAFARQADDFADEGVELPETRIARLADFGRELDAIERGSTSDSSLFQQLGPMIRTHALPIGLFRDLLSAFEQDVTKTRYADFGEVMDYCKRSANPVGRLLLHLYRETEPRSLACSDGICSALQLINFLQDIPIDYAKGRIYMPADEMRRFGIDETDLAASNTNPNWRPFMRFQIERARNMLLAGAPLGRVLAGRIGLELRMIVRGGERILEMLYASGGDVFTHRPVLQKRDWVTMFARAVLKR